MNSDIKRGLNLALKILNNQQRCSLEWELMTDCDDGQYIDFEVFKTELIEALQTNTQLQKVEKSCYNCEFDEDNHPVAGICLACEEYSKWQLSTTV